MMCIYDVLLMIVRFDIIYTALYGLFSDLVVVNRI